MLTQNLFIPGQGLKSVCFGSHSLAASNTHLPHTWGVQKCLWWWLWGWSCSLGVHREWDGAAALQPLGVFSLAWHLSALFGVFLHRFSSFFKQTLSRSLFNAFNFFFVSSASPWGLYWTCFFTWRPLLVLTIWRWGFNLFWWPLSFRLLCQARAAHALGFSRPLCWCSGGSGWCTHSRFLIFHPSSAFFPPFFCFPGGVIVLMSTETSPVTPSVWHAWPWCRAH